MDNRGKVILIVVVLAVMGLLMWLMSGNDPVEPVKKKQAFVSSNWNKEYQNAEKHPKGLYLFNKLLRTYIDTNRTMQFVQTPESFDSVMKTRKKNTYVFVGNRFGLEDNEFDTLLTRVEDGSDLFLAYHALTENIIDALFEDYSELFDYSEDINVFMSGNKLHMINLYQTDTIATNWYAFSPNIDAKDSLIGLSSFMEMFNLIELKHGKGKIFLCTTPELFQNYQVKRTDGFRYTMGVHSLLPKDQSVYFLELGRLSDDYGTEDVDELDEGQGKQDDSYLKVIFQNKTLLKAFIFGILGILIYLLFRSKRIRPVVPYLEPKKNTTRAFMETITSIYFSKRNPYGMLSVQRRNFYSMVQKHFFIDLNRREGERELVSLAEKSNVPLDDIKALVNILETKEAFDVSDNVIVKVHKMKQDFYRAAGIIASHVIEKQQHKEVSVYRGLPLPGLMLLIGITAIFFGFYLLVGAQGIGIALWPVGGIILFLSIRQFNIPLIRINTDEIVYAPTFGKQQHYKRNEITRIEWDDQMISIVFRGQDSININQKGLGRHERAKLKRALKHIKTEELW